jgi:hypothetical protein
MSSSTAQSRVNTLLGHLSAPASAPPLTLQTALVAAADATATSTAPAGALTPAAAAAAAKQKNKAFKGPPTTKYGGHLVAQALKEGGISHVFTLTGGHIAPILVGCNQVQYWLAECFPLLMERLTFMSALFRVHMFPSII